MPDRPRRRLLAARDTLGAVIGAVLGLLPHVLHHVGLIAGAAFVPGAGGNALFYGLGLLLSVPMLRLHRRFRSWFALAIAVVVFTALFLLSALVVGPAITADGGGDQTPRQPSPSSTVQHSGHHPSGNLHRSPAGPFTTAGQP